MCQELSGVRKSAFAVEVEVEVEVEHATLTPTNTNKIGAIRAKYNRARWPVARIGYKYKTFHFWFFVLCDMIFLLATCVFLQGRSGLENYSNGG